MVWFGLVWFGLVRGGTALLNGPVLLPQLDRRSGTVEFYFALFELENNTRGRRRGGPNFCVGECEPQCHDCEGPRLEFGHEGTVPEFFFGIWT